MDRGSASSLTEAGPKVSRSTMWRLLLSASAWKVRSRSIVWLSMYLSVWNCEHNSQVTAYVSWGVHTHRESPRPRLGCWNWDIDHDLVGDPSPWRKTAEVRR